MAVSLLCGRRQAFRERRTGFRDLFFKRRACLYSVFALKREKSAIAVLLFAQPCRKLIVGLLGFSNAFKLADSLKCVGRLLRSSRDSLAATAKPRAERVWRGPRRDVLPVCRAKAFCSFVNRDCRHQAYVPIVVLR